MSISRILSAAAALCLLAAGCAGPRKGAVEYHERRPTSDTFQVLYNGDGYTHSERAQDLALLRAAELCLHSGLPRFIVLDERRPQSGLTVRGFAKKPTGFFTFDAAYISRTLRGKYGISGNPDAQAPAPSLRELRDKFAKLRGGQRLRLSFEDSPPNEYVFMGYYPEEDRVALRPASGGRFSGVFRSLSNIRSLEPVADRSAETSGR